MYRLRPFRRHFSHQNSFSNSHSSKFYHSFRITNARSHSVFKPAHLSNCLAQERSSAFLFVSTRSFSISTQRQKEIVDLNEVIAQEANQSLGQNAAEAFSQIAATDPSFAEIGLNKLSVPTGWLQMALESLHVTVGLEWWQSIIVATITLRILTLPLIVATRRNMVHQQHHGPQLAQFREALMNASTKEEHMRENAKMVAYRKAHGINELGMIVPMLCNGVLFSCQFFALRGLCEKADLITSLKSGGALWFIDLSVQDPAFLLPVLAASTTLLSLHFGAEMLPEDKMGQFMKKFMTFMIVGSIPVMCYFPAALNVYWCTNNVYSLALNGMMRQESVMKALNIPEMRKYTPEEQAIVDKSTDFLSNFREMQRQAEDRAMKAEKMKETVRTSRKFGIDVKQSQGLKVAPPLERFRRGAFENARL